MKIKTKRTIRTIWLSTAFAVFLMLCLFILHQAYKRFYNEVYPLNYQAQVMAASEEHTIPPSLIYAVIDTESGFDPQALSKADAKGLMQLTDDTFRWAMNRAGEKDKYTVNALFDPAVNIHYGTYVLALLGEQFENTETVLAAYNAGQGIVSQWLRDPRYSDDGKTLRTIPYPETAGYVKRVLDTQKRYQELYSIP